MNIFKLFKGFGIYCLFTIAFLLASCSGKVTVSCYINSNDSSTVSSNDCSTNNYASTQVNYNITLETAKNRDPSYYSYINRIVMSLSNYVNRNPVNPKSEQTTIADATKIANGSNYLRCGNSEVECSKSGYQQVFGLHTGTEIRFMGIRNDKTPMKIAADTDGKSTPRTYGYFFPGAGNIGWKATEISANEDADYCGKLTSSGTPVQECFNSQYFRGGGDVFVHCYSESFGSKAFRNSCWRGFYVDAEIKCSGDIANPFDDLYCRKDEGFEVSYHEPISVQKPN
ncbi:MAG: hypothetical protein QM523_02630 [Candidatus Pacebacteria bacterium]|nr:hypothetical protein [Candidatus Paceibacterota bacterium]